MSGRTLVAVVVVGLLALGCAGCVSSPGPAAVGPATPSVSLHDDFQAGRLDTATWTLTQDGDLAARETDVVDADPGAGDLRLRLGADTLGTRDETVKVLGVRSVRPVELGNASDLAFDLDWNNQTNGCYLSASVLLSPNATGADPEDERDWLKIEYVGVPPGRNARALVVAREAGRTTTLFSDGWPENRAGRPIGVQRVRVEIRDGRVRVVENDRELCRSEGPVFSRSPVFVYLQMSSHSNYPLREVLFDNVSAAPAAGA